MVAKRKSTVSKTSKRKVKANLDERAHSLGLEKLQSSGLDEDDARQLGIEFLSREESHKLVPGNGLLCSLKLNYFDPRDGSPLNDWPKAPPYWRLRYLEQGHEFADQTDKKPLRYVQPFDTAPVAYYPQNHDDWPTLLSEPAPIIITEGELKAAKACKEGFPTIGLGGVDSFAAKRMGVVWLESLRFVNWVGRHVYICFDSDMRRNPNVLGALERLADELEQQGAHPYVVILPELDGPESKIGLDDFLIHEHGGPDEFAGLLSEAEPLGLSRALFHLNERYVYVADPGLIVNDKTNAKHSPGAFKEHVAAPAVFIAREFDQEGNIRTKTTSAAAAWIKWPLRRAVDKITYAPGKEKFIFNGASMYNTWQGWGLEPRPGDCSLFLDLVDHLFQGADPGAKEWFLKWCAYPLQYPGVKLYSDVLIYGRKHGTGKSLIGYTLGRIYGKNFTEIKQKNLHENHNEWAENKQFIMGDDITGSNKREDNDLLKNLVTQREIRLNPKYIPSYTVPDVINYFFTANNPDTFFMDDDDRRHFIHEVKVQPLPEEFYVEYDLWLDSGGAAALFDYLLKLDTSDFNPAARAFDTQAKKRMITDTQSDLGAWVRRLIEDPDHVLRIGSIKLKKDLFSNRELLELYDPEKRTGTTANGLGRELRRAGIDMVNDGKPVRLAEGSERLYAVRNADTWLNAPIDELAKHVGEATKGKSAKY
ncbi:primase [Pseudoxanthomonas phage PW916]|nr:primase [Pseudoxanthomonas phage PW916]